MNQNAAGKDLTGISKKDNIFLVFDSPCLIPVTIKINFKTPVLSYKALNVLSPSYLEDLIVVCITKRTLRLRSADCSFQNV